MAGNGHNASILEACRELIVLGVPMGQITEWSTDPQRILTELAKLRLQKGSALDENAVPALPGIAVLAEGLSKGASPWMDEYIAYATKWSPWSFSGYHKSIGLWALSVVAAGRVGITVGRRRLTPLYVAIIGRTSVHAKTEGAMIARDIIREAGLSFLLGSNRTTPQKLLSDMAGKVPLDYDSQDHDEREQTALSLSFAGQKGWFCDEWGGLMASMMRPTGPMADFHALMRELYDGDAVYSSSTVARGSEKIDNPYLALLGSMTPADLFEHARAGSPLWRDGYLARFALIMPDPEEKLNEDIFPNEERNVPQSLVVPLRAWHAHLGKQEVEIIKEVNGDGKETGRYKAVKGERPLQQCVLGNGVFEAYSNYVKAMRRLVTNSTNTDLDGSYTRLPLKALRVAMLIASLENAGYIDLRHWAWAQEYTEELRVYLHRVYATVTSGSPSQEVLGENRIISTIRNFMASEKQYPTAREIGQRVHMTTKKVQETLTALMRAGIVEELEPAQSGRRRGAAYMVSADPALEPANIEN